MNFMTAFYKKTLLTNSLDAGLFRAPTSEYRGAPFWCWNNKLSWEQLEPQIEHFQAMGMGGFHIHVRTGLATPYLGEEFMALVRASTEKAAENGMLTWLYDEDRWPSGYGGGLVTKEERFRAKHLLFTRFPYGVGSQAAVNISGAVASRNENGVLLARYDVELQDGLLVRYRRLEEGAEAKGTVWYAYLETAKPVAWFNNQTYVDTLNAEATKRFIQVTHEAYAREVGGHFGTTIPAIFTDEPQFPHKSCFHAATDTRDLVMPFTTDLLETYARTYGQRLEDFLPELFWELPGGRTSLARYRYHDHVCERFASAYADVLGAWCEAHGLALTGHMMEEPTLRSQSNALGEAMRSYRAFQIPGIDILCDAREYTTAKQAQSAVHQYGRQAMLSELYGVTGWDFDFAGHKGQGDWQAALGVTIRNHHLTWVSMGGEAKRDYPASIGHHSPWFEEYKLVEDHFARVNTALTRGKPVVRVGVIHPIESYWLCFGPLEQTGVEREEREKQFSDLTEWLLFGQQDFNFICESLLPSQSVVEETPTLNVGAMAYDAVIVPPMRTIRATTLARLESFASGGGTVIFAGDVPSLVDAVPSEAPGQLAGKCRRVSFCQTNLLQALEPFRELETRLSNARLADSLLYQMRQDGDTRYLFLCNTDRVLPRNGVSVKVRGEWAATHWNTLTGECEALAAEYDNGWTVIRWDFPGCGSLLLQLEPGTRTAGKAYAPPALQEIARLDDPASVSLSEPNVLLLDQARWRLAGDPAWEPVEEILRLDNLVKRKLGLLDRTGGDGQPWTDTAEPPILAHVELRYEISSAIPVAAPVLALEDAGDVGILWNGAAISTAPTGWWVDEAIQTVPLPDFAAGVHELILKLPYHRRSGIENAYLLGDFGVRVLGRRAEIIEPVRRLSFGDWTQQGLPFYAGNVTYHCQFTGLAGSLELQVAHFKSPVLSIALDGAPVGKIAFPPFSLALGDVQPTSHALDLTVYGNRFNAFGSVHHTDPAVWWKGPGSYRSIRQHWAYEYLLRPMGILSAPSIDSTISH